MDCNFQNIDAVFKKINNDSNWDIKQNLKWGFFFIHKSPDLLQKLCDFLLKEWHTYEDLRKIDNSKDWILCISKSEIHTPESLHEKNLYFNSLAELLKIDSYDGWDVGPLWME